MCFVINMLKMFHLFRFKKGTSGIAANLYLLPVKSNAVQIGTPVF
jgi:hypothetical protein